MVVVAVKEEEEEERVVVVVGGVGEAMVAVGRVIGPLVQAAALSFWDPGGGRGWRRVRRGEGGREGEGEGEREGEEGGREEGEKS